MTWYASLGATDPLDPDSDGDGRSDGDEVNLHDTDPTAADASGLLEVAGEGNAPDMTGFGAVAARYLISEREVSVGQYASFLNAVAATDPGGLYHPSMPIDRRNVLGSYVYDAQAGAERLPITWVSLWDAMRMANWVHHGYPIGAQDATTTEDGAYTLDPSAIAANTVARNPGAQAVIPSEDAWYKAAYYDVSSGVYRDYPTDSDLPASCSAPSEAPNRANCGGALGGGGTATDTGSYAGSAAPSGTFDQGGNVWEWTEDVEDASRRVRGGAFDSLTLELSADLSGATADPSAESDDTGFRLPEPGGAWPLASAILALATLRARRRGRESLRRFGYGRSTRA